MIEYFSEDIEFILNETKLISDKINNSITCEKKFIGDVNIIFTSDNYLLEMNKQYLKHDYYTDVITFDYTQNDKISGDIFISIDTVKDNAVKYSVEFLNELERVILHGVLHLIGYKDKNENEKKLIRSKEDLYLNFSPTD